MKLKIFLFSLLFSLTILAQENTQSIELPDFVITGKEYITIPKVKKNYPDFIPLVSRDFLTPQAIDEEDTPIKLSDPEIEIVNLGNHLQKNNALLKIQAGSVTLPSGDFYYNDWVKNFSFSSHLFGLNELEYVKNAGISLTGGQFGAKYFVDNSANVLPGMEISFNGVYVHDTYNYYGSVFPSIEQSTDNGNVNLSFNYNSSSIFNFGVGFLNNYYLQKSEKISENVFGINAYTGFNYDNINLSIETNYKNQAIQSDSLNPGNQTYFSASALVGFLAYDLVNLKAGIYVAQREGNSFFAPRIIGSLKFTDKISFLGEFSPNTEFVTLSDFKGINPYYKLNGFTNSFIENNFNLKFALKYEYEKFFEISTGVGYINSDNNIYFEDNVLSGFFNVYKEDIENYNFFVNMIFRKGPFGEFYGDIKLQKVTSQTDDYLPYTPTVLANLSYRNYWENGLGLKLDFNYQNAAYTDYSNTNKMPEMIYVGTTFYYELFNNFKLTLAIENLFNQDYYYFRNYKAKPIDLIAGFEYKW